MKYCLSSRQQTEYLQKADEIFVEMRDHKQIPELAEKYPDKDIILEWRPDVDDRITQEDLRDYSNLTRKKLIVCTSTINPEIHAFFTQNEIRYFWGYDISTPEELLSITTNYSPCYIRVAAPLFFQMELVSKYNVPVRLTPNLASAGYFPLPDHVNGTWVRPEDIQLYEPIATAAEFLGVNLEQERALFRIYAEEHVWPGEVSMIIKNLGPLDCMNRMLPQEFTEARLNCRQRCTAFGSCRLCYRRFNLADPEKLRPFLNKKEN